MPKILFLLPPSEGKQSWGDLLPEKVSFAFEKPLVLATQATQKDLKCTAQRYQEAIQINLALASTSSLVPTLPAIERYRGVMYNAISYETFTPEQKDFFEEHFLIISGMYGLVKPRDRIANYKLPIECKWLYTYRGNCLLDQLISLQPEYLINLLPGAYEKLFSFNKNREKLTQAGIKLITVDFLTASGKKVAHGVKKIKGERIHQLCKMQLTDPNTFVGENVIQNWNQIIRVWSA